jgi:hypothetical protein
MITITSAQAIGYLILSPLFLAVILMFLLAVVRLINNFFQLQNRNKTFKEMKDNVEKFKAEGNFHTWINFPINETETVHVCSTTGFAPSKDGFVPLQFIQKFLKEQEEKEAYAKFKSEKMSTIARNFGLKLDEMEALVNEVVSIPQEYTVGKLQALQDELKVKAKEVEASLK